MNKELCLKLCFLLFCGSKNQAKMCFQVRFGVHISRLAQHLRKRSCKVSSEQSQKQHKFRQTRQWDDKLVTKYCCWGWNGVKGCHINTNSHNQGLEKHTTHLKWQSVIFRLFNGPIAHFHCCEYTLSYLYSNWAVHNMASYGIFLNKPIQLTSSDLQINFIILSENLKKKTASIENVISSHCEIWFNFLLCYPWFWLQ